MKVDTVACFGHYCDRRLKRQEKPRKTQVRMISTVCRFLEYYDLFWGCRQSQQFHFYFIFFFSHHYMFRPLQAILRWNIHSRFWKQLRLQKNWKSLNILMKARRSGYTASSLKTFLSQVNIRIGKQLSIFRKKITIRNRLFLEPGTCGNWDHDNVPVMTILLHISDIVYANYWESVHWKANFTQCMGKGENCITSSFEIFTLRQV
jgi:hypothetical protein